MVRLFDFAIPDSRGGETPHPLPLSLKGRGGILLIALSVPPRPPAKRDHRERGLGGEGILPQQMVGEDQRDHRFHPRDGTR